MPNAESLGDRAGLAALKSEHEGVCSAPLNPGDVSDEWPKAISVTGLLTVGAQFAIAPEAVSYLLPNLSVEILRAVGAGLIILALIAPRSKRRGARWTLAAASIIFLVETASLALSLFVAKQEIAAAIAPACVAVLFGGLCLLTSRKRYGDATHITPGSPSDGLESNRWALIGAVFLVCTATVNVVNPSLFTDIAQQLRAILQLIGWHGLIGPVLFRASTVLALIISVSALCGNKALPGWVSLALGVYVAENALGLWIVGHLSFWTPLRTEETARQPINPSIDGAGLGSGVLLLAAIVIWARLWEARSQILRSEFCSPSAGPKASQKKGARICPVCGEVGLGAFCGNCGSPLALPKDDDPSPVKSAFQHGIEGAKKASNATNVLVGVKTAWLLALRPVEFFAASFGQNKPLASFRFPFERMLRQLSRKPAGVTPPIAFYLAGISLAIAGGWMGGTDRLFAGPLTQRLEHRMAGKAGAMLVKSPTKVANKVATLGDETLLLLALTFAASTQRIFFPKGVVPRSKFYTFTLYTIGLQAAFLGIACFISPPFAVAYFFTAGVYVTIVLPAVVLPRLFSITPRRVVLSGLGSVAIISLVSSTLTIGILIMISITQ
jgi:hypothetical protein